MMKEEDIGGYIIHTHTYVRSYMSVYMVWRKRDRPMQEEDEEEAECHPLCCPKAGIHYHETKGFAN